MLITLKLSFYSRTGLLTPPLGHSHFLNQDMDQTPFGPRIDRRCVPRRRTSCRRRARSIFGRVAELALKSSFRFWSSATRSRAPFQRASSSRTPASFRYPGRRYLVNPGAFIVIRNQGGIIFPPVRYPIYLGDFVMTALVKLIRH